MLATRDRSWNEQKRKAASAGIRRCIAIGIATGLPTTERDCPARNRPLDSTNLNKIGFIGTR
jgi:hypothetical protein